MEIKEKNNGSVPDQFTLKLLRNIKYDPFLINFLFLFKFFKRVGLKRYFSDSKGIYLNSSYFRNKNLIFADYDNHFLR